MVAQMPHDWREASSITVHLHWYLTVAPLPGEDVKWDLLYRAYDVDQARPAGWTTLQNTITVWGRTVWVHYLDSWTTIVMTGFQLSCLVDLRVQRDTQDAADDHEQDVILKEVDIHYQRDSFGSVAPTRKWG
jgi:hypothetical protein